MFIFCFFKQKTAYEVRISDWSSDVCSSDLAPCAPKAPAPTARAADKAANIAIIERSLRIFHRQCACCALRGRLNLLLRPDFLRHPERPGVACHFRENGVQFP